MPEEKFHLKIPHYDDYFENFMFFSKHAKVVVKETKAELDAIVKYLEALRQSVVDQISAFREEEDVRKELLKEASKQHDAAVAEIVRILEGFESVAGEMIELAKRDRRQQNRK